MMTNENGRSMVEMLGVLAIIGVLSVGGIAGYTMAMNKYKANEIAASAAQCGVMAVAKASVSGDIETAVDCSTLMTVPENVSSLVSSMNVATDSDESTVTVTLTDKTGGLQSALTGLATSSSVNGFNLVVAS